MAKVNVQILKEAKVFPDWADAILVVPVLYDPEWFASVLYFKIVPLKRSRYGDYYYAKKTWRSRFIHIEDTGEKEVAFDELYCNVDGASIITKDGEVIPTKYRENDKYIKAYPRKNRVLKVVNV